MDTRGGRRTQSAKPIAFAVESNAKNGERTPQQPLAATPRRNSRELNGAAETRMTPEEERRDPLIESQERCAGLALKPPIQPHAACRMVD